MLLLPFQIIAEYRERDAIFNQAREKANSLAKPLLNCGCGTQYSRAIMESDVNLDVVPRNAPNFVLGTIEDMSMFQDKQFGVAYCAHVLEHVKDLARARSELERVADYQFIITPSPFWLTSWLMPGHRRVFGDTRGEAVMFELPPKV